MRTHVVSSRLVLLLAGSHVTAVPASAQRIPDLNAPKRAAMKAADSTNSRLAQQTGQAIPVRRGATAPAQASGPPASNGANSVSVGKTLESAASTGGPSGMTPVTREVYSYEPEGRRDPFYSLILTTELRPLISDLKLVAVLYDATGRRSVAILRDLQTNEQYKATVGLTLGRMRVSQIKPRAVLFSIDEFGLNRLDSLFLADSTKRIR